MAFDDDGFLSPDLVAWTATIRTEFKDWFELVESFNRDAMKVLRSIKPSLSKNQQLVAALLYGRALQSFQGTVLMAERGMIADALTLVRSCAATAIAIGGVAVDEKFVDDLIEAHDSHHLSYANVILNDPESLRELTPEQIDNLQQVIAQVTGKYKAPRPRRIKWDRAAKKAKMSALYDTIYRMTSGDAVHTTVLALDRHIQPDDHRTIGHLTFRPESRDPVQTLSMAANALLHAMEAMARIFPEEGFERTGKSYMDRWQKTMHPLQ